MKRKQRTSGMKLRLSKETIRHMLPKDLQQVAAAAGVCYTMNGCGDPGDSFGACTSIHCSKLLP